MYLSSFPSFPIFRFNVQNRRFTTSPSSARVVLLKRLRDSGLAELTIAVVAAFPVFLFFDYEWVSNQISAWHGSASEGLSPAGWWFTCISSPIIRFFQLRWV